MKIRELLEQQIAPVGPGETPTGSNPTQPTEGPPATPGSKPNPNDPNSSTGNNTDQQPNPQELALVKNNLNNLKPSIKAAGGGDIDANVLAKAILQPNMQKNAQGTPMGSGTMNPQVAKQMNAVAGALGTVEKNATTGNVLKNNMNTAANLQKLQQQKANPIGTNPQQSLAQPKITP